MIITLVIIGGLNQAGNRGFNCRGFSTSYKSTRGKSNVQIYCHGFETSITIIFIQKPIYIPIRVVSP